MHLQRDIMPSTVAAVTGMIAAVAAVAGVVVTVHINAQTQAAQRVTQRQADFSAASQQLAAGDAFSQAAGITTFATLVKNDPTTYRDPVCQIVPPYITQAAALDLAHAPKATGSVYDSSFAYRPGVLLAIQNISPVCPNWNGFQLSRWSLIRTDLSGAHLPHADLMRSELFESDLAGANLNGADLTGTDLGLADLTGANLSGANLTGADLSDAHLSGASLSSANLTGTDLTGTYLDRADLSGVNLPRADLTLKDLTGANLTFADLSGANLTFAHLSGANLTYTDLTRAHLTGADLTGADLTGAHLTGADLSGAKLGRIKYDKYTTEWPQGFVPPPSR